MKIAFFVPIIDQVGGAELSTWRLAERLVQRSHQITIITTQAIRNWRKHPSIIDYTKHIRLIRLPVWQRSRHVFGTILTAQALWAVPLFLRDTQILHLRGLTPESLTIAKIARRLGIATVCVPMASGLYGDAAMLSIDISKNFAVFDWMSVLTETLRDEVIEWGFPAHKIGIIPNGVDVDFFRPGMRHETEPSVIFVGQFRPEKRVDLLLRAWKQVQHDCLHSHLTLVGGGQYIDYYREIAAQLNLSPTFIPNTDASRVLMHLQSNSIFVMPGISEGMSNALLEAMAVGLAPAVADTPANQAVIKPEVNGLCYDSDSSEALAVQIKRLLVDKDLRQHIGATARQTVIEHFNLESVTDQYLALYTQLVGEKY